MWFWSDLRGDQFVARQSDPGVWRSAWWQCECGGERVSRVSRFSPAVSRAVSVTSGLVRRAIPATLLLGRRGSVSLNAERMLLECIRCGEKIAGRPGPFDPRRSAGVWSLFGG
jgi:hypothetical protein